MAAVEEVKDVVETEVGRFMGRVELPDGGEKVREKDSAKPTRGPGSVDEGRYVQERAYNGEELDGEMDRWLSLASRSGPSQGNRPLSPVAPHEREPVDQDDEELYSDDDGYLSGDEDEGPELDLTSGQIVTMLAPVLIPLLARALGRYNSLLKMKHNNLLPNQHFRKDWARRVKTWFDQPGAKKTRRIARIAKAAAIAPRPVDGLLRPAVRGQTIRYNHKLRAGRGFTLDELKGAGIRVKYARSIGIAVDNRRKNRSAEGLKNNVERLTAYRNKLVVFPKKLNKPKHGDSTGDRLKGLTQLTGFIHPIAQPPAKETTRKISGPVKATAYATLRKARSDKRLKGVREARAKAAEEEEKAKNK
ncbi:60S ribosomal protein L13 [Irineochytrium annulatum]|nr:60S ribosomal protein L13 [Irineochytrium annulatum]